jgi:hypothetical protein
MSSERRGFFGLSLTCEDCFVQRGPGRVAYTRSPAITSVTDGSAAEAAGLRTGDTIVAIEGLQLTTPEGFERWANARAGQAVRLTIRRNGQEREVTITPTDRSSASTIQDFYRERLRIAQVRGLDALRGAYRSPMGWLGIGLECEQCSVMSLGRRMEAWSFRVAPTVLTVDVDGPAHRAGLRRGDTLTAIDGVDLTTREGGRAFGRIEPNQRVVMTVRRDGRERQVTLTAVVRPDASREEIAAFEEYRGVRDSADAQYRAYLADAMARASAEMAEMQRQLRDVGQSRGSVDSARRRLMTVDSLLRVLRRAEAERAQASGIGWAYAAPTPPATPTLPLMPVPVAPGAYAITGRATATSPLRYSGRLAEVVNIEARAPGAVSVDELGDSAVVVTGPGVLVKVSLRCLVPASQVRSDGDSIVVRGVDPSCRKIVVPKP